MTRLEGNPLRRSTAHKKIVLAHPSGNEVVRAVLAAIQGAGLLDTFYTSVACFPDSKLDRVASKIPVLSDLKKRSFAPDLRDKTKTSPFRELGRIATSKVGLTSFVKHEVGYFSVDEVYHALDRKVASFLEKDSLNGIGAIYAFEDGAEYSFKVARENGLKNLYDLPIGYWRYARKLMAEEQELRPEWAETITGFLDSEKKLARKDEEIRLADHIFVASTFTATSLKEYPGQLPPISVVPYGFPPACTERMYLTNNNGPLKVLFVGGLSQRKGIANIFEAVKPLKKHISLTVVGKKAVEGCDALNNALTAHRWIPSLPHAEILELMRQHDLLVFPSLFEGFGLVITEAMSQGTPVITTDRTVGPDLINHGENGWLVDAGSTIAIQETLEKILENRNVIETVGRAALSTAEKRPWSKFGAELVHEIQKLVG
jgi:glycosyltransferase involved in cell wall biosynthesis